MILVIHIWICVWINGMDHPSNREIQWSYVLKSGRKGQRGVGVVLKCKSSNQFGVKSQTHGNKLQPRPSFKPSILKDQDKRARVLLQHKNVFTRKRQNLKYFTLPKAQWTCWLSSSTKVDVFIIFTKLQLQILNKSNPYLKILIKLQPQHLDHQCSATYSLTNKQHNHF